MRGRLLHITSGDVAGGKLARSGIEGEVFVWRDILYEGPRKPGWPGEEALAVRAAFLEEVTGGGLSREEIVETLRSQYLKLAGAGEYDGVVLWFDACLFDLSMLCHILACAGEVEMKRLELVYLASWPGIVPFHGLGELSPEELLRAGELVRPVSEEQMALASEVDRAFAAQDRGVFLALARRKEAPLPGLSAAVRRWLEEEPDEGGLGKLERLALESLQAGCRTPQEIFRYVAEHDTPPQYWGDITLWGKINGLALRNPPLLAIKGPAPRLPQWGGEGGLGGFRVEPC